MSSMLSVFQVPVVSVFHEIGQAAPAWKTCPGPGFVGVTSAKATNAMDKKRVEKALRENMADRGGKSKRKRGANVGRQKKKIGLGAKRRGKRGTSIKEWTLNVDGGRERGG
jgi:hypothetical protein